MEHTAPFFELKNISKYFARVIANKDVSLSIEHGEVLALLGENGAGKSTVMKILYGLYKADEGIIRKNGEEVRISSPKDAMDLGISMIQQHFSLVPAHTVIENIILGTVKGKIDYSHYRGKLEQLMTRYGFSLDLDKKISELDVGQQQKVEILKALYMDANLLIMDEPTAVLTPQETQHLMDFVREFTAAGNAVIFITHKLKEVMDVADRIIVMRDGQISGTVRKDDTNEFELSKMMIGRNFEDLTKKAGPPASAADQALEVRQISYVSRSGSRLLEDISFSIGQGEILGIAGVSGNGQEELCEALCGSISVSSGQILLNGQDITHLGIRERIERGIGYVPVNRHEDAMVPSMTIAENMMLRTSFAEQWKKQLFINESHLTEYTRALIERFEIKTPGPDERIGRLSGGNQQKAVVAREIDIGTSLLIINQPTRGLDLGALNHIHKTILDQRDAGKSVLLVSTELSEIFALSDRIAVMYKGRIMGIFAPRELDTETIGLLMAGYDGTKGGGKEWTAN